MTKREAVIQITRWRNYRGYPGNLRGKFSCVSLSATYGSVKTPPVIAYCAVSLDGVANTSNAKYKDDC